MLSGKCEACNMTIDRAMFFALMRTAGVKICSPNKTWQR